MEQENQHIPRQQVPSILSKVKILRGDSVLWVIVPILFIVSVLVVYSSVAKMGYADMGSETNSILMKHLLTIGAGLISMFIAYVLGSRIYHFIAPFAYVACWLFAFGLFFFGTEINGVVRWYNIMGVSVQPSEFLKLATIVLLARELSFRQGTIDRQRIIPSLNPMRWRDAKQKEIWRNGTLPILGPVIASCIVVFPTHFSSALIIFLLSLVIMFIGRVRMAELAKLVALVVAAVALALALGFGRSQTAGGRFDKFVESWQTTPDKPLSQLTDTEHAMVAIYDGGVLGVGAGRSVMRAKITHPESDYIFAFFVEEYGIFMAIFLVVIYLWIFARAVHIFRQCRWLFCGFLVLGMALIITGQAMLHFLVSINFFFETGQNLPIISHGGTSMTCMSVALGIILSISRQIEQGTLVPPEGYASMTPSDEEDDLQ